MLQRLTASQLDGGFNLIDIGASGALDRQWRRLEPMINLIGFEPNREECERLGNQPSRFRSMKFLPYAISGESGQADLHLTSSIYCTSLLPPNEKWLKRFKFADLFELVGVESIDTKRLVDVEELQTFDTDIIKTDTQGLELPILSNAGSHLERAFLVETETGFVPNYVGETTFDQMSEFMLDNGFLLFDMNNRHRIPRRNVFADEATGREQILWCEAVWLRDYASETGGRLVSEIDRGKALKALVLCAHQGCLDFGYELAGIFHQHGLLTDQELNELGAKRSWLLPQKATYALARQAYNVLFRLMPRGLRRELTDETDRVHFQPHAFKSAMRLLKRKRAA